MDIVNFNNVRVGHWNYCVDIRPTLNNHESYGTIATFHTLNPNGDLVKEVYVFKETDINNTYSEKVIVISCYKGHDPYLDKPENLNWELLYKK